MLSRALTHKHLTEAQVFFADQRRLPLWAPILASIGMLNTAALFLTLFAQY